MGPLPKRKHSTRRSGKRERGKLVFKLPKGNKCPKCGSLKLSHRACPNCGFYK